MTDYLFRVFLIVPKARKQGLTDFIKEEFDDADWLVSPLSSSGQDPATHYCTSFACTLSDTSKWASRLTTDGGVPLPAEFEFYNADQRIAFMTQANPTLKQLTGVSVHVCRNDQEWFNIEDILVAEGLQRVQSEPVS